MKNVFKYPLVLALATAFAWCYLLVGINLVKIWIDTPDYSHGFFVIPVALMIAWSRRETLPAEFKPAWPFGILLIAGLVIRWAGVVFTIEPIEHFSLLISLAGLIGFVGGAALFWWALPMVAYLIFMIRLPYAVAVTYAGKLQWLSAQGASFLLRAAGFPALADGNIIQMEKEQLDVAYACSGLQMIIAFLAVTSAIALLTSYPKLGKLLIALSAIPIAVICNIFRITATGIFCQFFEGEKVRLFFHDFGGYIFVPIAIAIAVGFIALYERTFPKFIPKGVT